MTVAIETIERRSMEIPFKVQSLIDARAKEVGVDRPGRSCNLYHSGILDSFAIAVLISTIEEELSVVIPDDDFNESNFRSLESIASYIERLQQG